MIDIFIFISLSIQKGAKISIPGETSVKGNSKSQSFNGEIDQFPDIFKYDKGHRIIWLIP